MRCTWLEKSGSVRNHSLKGFTLIELICVVIIISVLTAASLPQINKYFDTLELSSFSRDLQVYMNYLCQRAIVERKIIYFNIDQDKKQYWAYTTEEGNILKVYHIPERITVASEQKQVVFYPDGAIDKVSIKLMNRDNQYVSLTTRRVFGGAKLEF